MATTVLLRAPAKVNLFLGVGERLSDGYHAVRTVLHALELSDEVKIAEAEKIQVVCDPPLNIAEQENLAFRAALALAAEFEREPAANITITKRIPHGAGLAGGSSDAAAVLAGLARLWGLDPLHERCVRVARSLGADVAFFLRGGAVLMGGRGDEFVESLPPAAGVPIVLVRPPAPVPTAEAYRAFDAAPVSPGDPGPVVAALNAADPASLALALGNNLENAACSIVPQVCEALAWVRGQRGVLGAAVAGSGSAVFAVVEEYAQAERIAESASERGWWGAATRLAEEGVAVIDERAIG